MEPRQEAHKRMSTKRLDRLSEVIIDTLKTLSGEQQKLTPGTLSEALRGREDFWRLLDANGKSTATRAMNRDPDAGLAAPALLAPAQTDAGHGDLTAEASASSPDGITGLSGFYRKSVLTLIALAQENENRNLSDSLDQLRLLILGNCLDLGTLNDSLQQIKNAILKEAPDSATTAGTRTPGGPSFWSFWQRRSKPHKDDALSEDLLLYVQRLQSTFLAITDELQFGLGEGQQERFADIKGRFASSRDFEMLLAPTDDLIGLIQAYIKRAAQQRDEIASFVKELGTGLLEMEKQLITSLTHTQETYEFNSEFNSSLQGQLEDIKASFSISKSFEEIRSFVLGKLKAIRTALESKRKQDESYLQNAHEKMGDLQKGFERMKKEVGQVQKKTKILEQEILLDNLTGIYNRRAYELRIREEISRFQRYGQPFSLVLFDIDHFKKVNDQFGHQAGDKCLREIATRIRPSLRDSDFLARYGGEEFIIILPGTGEEDAHRVAEKIRSLIEKTRFVYQGAEVPVTISLGVTQVQSSDQDSELPFRRVDAAMYQAKKEGRNRTHRM